MSFRALKEFLPRFIQKPQIKKGLRRVLIFETARELTAKFLGLRGEVLKDELKFEFKKGTLFIFCQNNYLSQEITFYKEELRDRINQKIGEDGGVKKVVVRRIS